MFVWRRAASFFALFLSVFLTLEAQSRPPAQPDDPDPPPRTLPMQEGTTRFAIVGDMGTGSTRQRETARTMTEVQSRFTFTFVITVGDNIYGGQGVGDMERKFSLPYKPLLDRGVTFHASLGNHDKVGQRFYKLFNMGGERYYTFTRGPVQFFALDSTLMTREQLNWLELGLERSTSRWKIAYFHHPLYSSGRRHGPQMGLRGAIEPLLGSYGTQVVFAGHEHFYERSTLQRGIQHFITGSGGQLRKGNIRRSSDTAAGFDTDNAFMVVEVNDEELHFETISRQAETVDAGVIGRTGGIRTTTR